MWKVSSTHGIAFFGWNHFSFRFDNTGCRARREFRDKFEYQLSRPKLLEKELETWYFWLHPHIAYCFERISSCSNLHLTPAFLLGDFWNKGSNWYFCPIFFTLFQTTFVANSFHNMDWECDFQSFSYNSGNYRKTLLIEPVWILWEIMRDHHGKRLW